MVDLVHDASADRAYCPGCGASLALQAEQALMTCEYCGSECKVVRRLRRLEPELPDGPEPKPPVDPAKDYASWGSEALVWGILNGTDVNERIAMARALDTWPHAHNDKLVPLVARYVAAMLTAPAELDKAMRGILGKLICHDDLKRRNAVIRAGQRYGFTHPGSHGLLFALSLGNAGTVKLLLEIAEWAQEKGLDEYCRQAVIGVQTAIGRAGKHRHVCNEILLHRLPYVTGTVRDWILKHTLIEFDVGYTQHRPWVLELIDDMAFEKPTLIEPLADTLRKCGGARDAAKWRARIAGVGTLKSRPARLAALRSLRRPPPDVDAGSIAFTIDALAPFLTDDELCRPAAKALAGLIPADGDVPPGLKDLWRTRGAALPRELAAPLEARLGAP